MKQNSSIIQHISELDNYILNGQIQNLNILESHENFSLIDVKVLVKIENKK